MLIATTLLLCFTQSAPAPAAPPAATPPSVVAPKLPATPTSGAPAGVDPPPVPLIAPSNALIADCTGKPGIAGLLAPDARPDKVIGNTQFAEGPTSDSFGQTYFCDISAARVYRIVRVANGVRADEIISESGGCSGLAFSRDGHLYSTQMGTGRLVEVQLFSDGTAKLVGVVENYEGKMRPGVNDLVTTPEGGIWYTNMGDKRQREATGLYFTTAAGGEPIQITTPIVRPNGTRISPDGRHLYVTDFIKPALWEFPVEGPGKLGSGRILASLAVLPEPARVNGGDGMAVDSKGNIWVAVPSAQALIIFDPQGKPLGRVLIPESPSNCAFGGADGRTLYITAQTSVYVLQTLVDGFWTARGGTPAVELPAPLAPAAPPSAAPIAPAPAPPSIPASPSR